MLARNEICFNFKCVHLLSQFNFIPFKINVKTATISAQKSARRKWIWQLLYFCFNLHLLFNGFRLAESAIHPELYFVPIHFPNHFIDVGCCLLGTFWMKSLVTWQNNIVIVWNHLFTNDLAHDDEKRRSLLKLSLQELLLVFLSPFCHGTAAFLLILLTVDPTRQQLPYSVLNQSYQTWGVYAILSMFEGMRLIFEMTIFYFIILIQLSVFDKSNADLKQGTDILQNNRDSNNDPTLSTARLLLASYKICRETQLLIQIFNQSNQYLIFYMKLFCITSASTLCFFAIRFFHVDPLISLLNYYMVFVVITLYCILFDKAFSIANNIKQFKMEIRLASKAKLSSFNCGQLGRCSGKYIERAILSIPNIGIEVGRFHTMERVSTIVFLGFVTAQIGNLLITFQ